jgi:TetR/AcrR family transcriptional regulator
VTIDDAAVLGRRAARTREAILAAARQLFLEVGYSGTRISNITDACGISRAGFYTYFKDKREVFSTLGESAYRDILTAVGGWDALPRACTLDDVTGWVRDYFGYMDRHGAFVLSVGQSVPVDEDIRAAGRRMQMRVAFLLGVALRSRQAEPTDTPEVLGLSVMGMLDRSWYYCRVQRLPVSDRDMVHGAAQLILQSLR